MSVYMYTNRRKPYGMQGQHHSCKGDHVQIYREQYERRALWQSGTRTIEKHSEGEKTVHGNGMTAPRKEERRVTIQLTRDSSEIAEKDRSKRVEARKQTMGGYQTRIIDENVDSHFIKAHSSPIKAHRST